MAQEAYLGRAALHETLNETMGDYGGPNVISLNHRIHQIIQICRACQSVIVIELLLCYLMVLLYVWRHSFALTFRAPSALSRAIYSDQRIK